MKKSVISLFAACFVLSLAIPVPLHAKVPNKNTVAQKPDEQLKQDIVDEKPASDEVSANNNELNTLSAEENKKALQLRRQTLKERKENEALRESSANGIEYTIDPSSVELVVEMDPNGYGFRTRNHRMTLSSDFDFLLRGRGMLHYDYRFFNYFSLGVLAGIDLSDMSLYSRFREHLSKPSPWQFSILGGVSGKWRLTEWYMRSAIFLEPSFLLGHMWQKIPTQKDTKHWRLRPGLFGGIETVFDSGLSLTARLGVEFPFDFGTKNAFREVVEPLFIIGFGFAI